MALFTTIGAAIFGAGTWLATATAVVLKAAVGIGLNLLASSRAGKQSQPSFAVNGTLQGGGDLSRSIPLGMHATAGSLVWGNTWGSDGDTPNALLTQVISIADMPIKGLSNVWVNKEKCTIDFSRPHPDGRGFPISEYRKDGNDNLWLKFYDGTQTTADNFLVTKASTATRQYSSRRIGKGIAYVIATALISKNMFSGFPAFTFEVDGMRLYDPSKDSTAGGNGTQRYSDPATWGGDGDYLPAVQLYNIFRGIRYNGVWLYGFQGVTAARLTPNWIKQINKCRAVYAGKPTYRSGGECPVEAPLSAAVTALLTACQGELAESGGVYDLNLGAPDAPEFSITDLDIITTKTQQFTPFFGLADMVTGMSGTYPSPTEGYSRKTAPPVIRPDLDAKAGGRRLMANVPFDFVPYPEQVQRLLKSGLLDGLRQRRHTFVLPSRFMPRSKPGRTFSWTSERNGYVNKLFKISGAQILGDCNVMIDVTECDPSDYDWQSSDYRPQIDGETGPIRPLPAAMQNFAVEASSIDDDDGYPRRPAILLKWKFINGIDFVEYELELSSDLSRVDNGYFLNPALSQEKIAPFTLLPDTSYRVRARYGSYESGAPFLWSEWLQIKTADIRLTAGKDMYPFNVSDFNKDLVQFWADQAENTRYINDEIDRLTTALSSEIAGATMERQSIRQNISVEVGEARAEYTNLITVQANATSALSSRVETVSATVSSNKAEYTSLISSQATEISALSGRVDTVTATVNDNKAEYTSLIAAESNQRQAQVTALQQLVSANEADIASVTTFSQTNVQRIDGRVDQTNANLATTNQTVSALSQTVTQTQVQVGNVTANGYFQVKSEANAGGSVSRISLTVSATAGGTPSQGALFIEAISGGKSRIVMDADQVIMTSGSARSAPFAFQAGVLTLMAAKVNDITAGRMRSFDNKVLFDLDQKLLVFRD